MSIGALSFNPYMLCRKNLLKFSKNIPKCFGITYGLTCELGLTRETRMKRILTPILATFALLTSAAIIHGCGSKSATSVDRAYAGAGSDWRLTLKADGTFTGTETES